MKGFRLVAAVLVVATVLGEPAQAQFTALSDINVIGSGLVPTESDYVPNQMRERSGRCFLGLPSRAHGGGVAESGR
jgi:hypothetical protein